MYRPSYQKDKTVNFTRGNEFVLANTLEDYVGIYTLDTRGRPLSDPTVTKGQVEVLTKKPLPMKTNTDTNTYYKIKRFMLQDRLHPTAYTPVVTKEDIDRGYMLRYVAQKKNEPHIIIEVDRKDTAIVPNDTSVFFAIGRIDPFIWRQCELRWIISGPYDEIIANNRKTLSYIEQRFPGISRYFTDLAEYVQVPVTRPDRIYTNGDAVPEQLPDSYQLHTSNTVPMGQACASCMFRSDINNCRKWNATVRNTHWCRAWELGTR
jgi:hypothetical protein